MTRKAMVDQPKSIHNDLPLFQRKTLLATTNFPWKAAISKMFNIDLEKLRLVAFNPWRGCKHNCSYCWVKPLIKRNKSIKPDGDFLNVELCSNVLERLAVELPKLSKSTVIIASTLTDIFQPGLFHSLALSKLFKEWVQALHGYKVLFITKNSDVMLYYNIFDKENHVIGFTLTGLENSNPHKKDYEQSASGHLSRIIATHITLKEGFRAVFISLEPYFIDPCDIIKDFISRTNIDLSKFFFTIGTCNYSLSDLWSKEDYFRFYDETLFLRARHNLNLWWKDDAEKKIKNWLAQKQHIIFCKDCPEWLTPKDYGNAALGCCMLSGVNTLADHFCETKEYQEQ